MNWPGLRPLLASGPLPWLLALAAAGFAGASASSWPGGFIALCGALERVQLSELHLALGPQPPLRGLLVGWLVMLIAMMPPLLAQPALHVWRSSLVSRRPHALLLFGFGYAMIWLVAGIVLLPAAIALKLTTGSAAQTVSLSICVLWSCSPIAQLARNACHRTRRVAAFGRSADVDCLRFGTFVGSVCVAACWPWMLVPMMFDALHLPVMALVSLVLFAERIAPPAAASWRLPPVLAVAAALMPTRKPLNQKVLGKP